MGESTPGQPEWLSLDAGERVWLRESPSRNLVLAALATGFVLLLAMSVAVGAMGDVATGRALSLVVLLFIVGLLVVAFVHTRRNQYVLTSDRVCAGVGLRSKRVTTLELAAVEDVAVEQSSWQQVMNVGTLRFVADGDDLTFSLVENPSHLLQQVLQLVDVEH